MAVAAVGDWGRGTSRPFGGLAALALLLASSGASAQAPVPPPWNPKAPENTQLLPTFNYATVESVLTAIGATSQRRGTAERPTLAVIFSRWTPYFLLGSFSRYFLSIFPLALLPALSSNRYLRVMVIVLFFALQIVLATIFLWGSWVS